MRQNLLSSAFRKIFVGCIIVIVFSCLVTRVKPVFVGNFSEKEYAFFDSFQHKQDSNYYYELPFSLKFGGIRNEPNIQFGRSSYSWLRQAKNLQTAFNAFEYVGLQKIVSKAMYFKKNDDWCCDTQWENQSLHDIVSGYLKSDTMARDTSYYSKFWSRRRKEGLVTLTYSIFKRIDVVYNEKESETEHSERDTVLGSLLEYDLDLMHLVNPNYSERVLEYFDYLKSVGLNYSAYKLTCNNNKVNFDQRTRDSLVSTIFHDTLNNGFCRINLTQNVIL